MTQFFQIQINEMDSKIKMNDEIENYAGNLLAERKRDEYRRDRLQSIKLDAIAHTGIGILFLASFALLIYWLWFDSGFAVLAPEQHRFMASIAFMYPGQAENVQDLLNDQGFLSLWQIRDITTNVSAPK